MTAIFVREVRSAFSGMMGWLLTAFLVAASGLYFMANNLGFGLTDFGYYTLYQTSFVLLCMCRCWPCAAWQGSGTPAPTSCC